MSRRAKARTIALLGALALVLTACPAPDDEDDEAAPDDPEDVDIVPVDPDEVFELTVVTYAIPGTAPLEMSEEWARRIEEMSGGRLQIDLHPGGALVGYGEEREALTEGVIDMGVTVPSFFAGDDPAFAAWFTVPAVPIENPERARYFRQQWARFGGGLELANELYEDFDITVIGTTHKSHEPVFSTTPIRSLEDFEGMRVRAAPGLVSEMFARVGAEPVAMPGGEIYTALDTGVIDAAEFVGADENFGAGLHEVTDYILFPAFHTPTSICDVTIRTEVWEELPRDLQLILEDAARWLDDRIDHDMGVRDIETLELLQTEFGIEVNRLSDEEYALLEEIAMEVTLEWRDESPMSERMVNSYLEFGEKMGFLDVPPGELD